MSWWNFVADTFGHFLDFLRTGYAVGRLFASNSTDPVGDAHALGGPAAGALAEKANSIELQEAQLIVDSVGLENALQYEIVRDNIHFFAPDDIATRQIDNNNVAPTNSQASFNDAAGSSFFRGSPIVLDLDQSGGIERVDVDDSQAFFDLDNDGFREHAEWVSGDDGFLALDANANGKIDDNSELFGDTGGHANGWDKLREHDTNSDNVIDANDAVFEELLIWKDLDGDGFTDEGELMTLTEAGIESITLPSQGEVVSSFEFIGGGTGYAEDVFFELNQMHTVYNGDVDLGQRFFKNW